MHDGSDRGEVAARSGVAVSTLHFYEAEGLIRAGETREINVGMRAKYFVALRLSELRSVPESRLRPFGRRSRHCLTNARQPPKIGIGCRRHGGPTWTSEFDGLRGCGISWMAVSAAVAFPSASARCAIHGMSWDGSGPVRSCWIRKERRPPKTVRIARVAADRLLRSDKLVRDGEQRKFQPRRDSGLVKDVG